MRIVQVSILVLVVVLVGIASSFRSRESKTPPAPTTDNGTCGALDPVMDPRYNMRQIVKQSILLEEHINNEKKRCVDCITKHFLHIIGLAEEAISLDPATPCYREVPGVYSAIFDAWQADHEDPTVPQELRAHRKVLMAEYFKTGGRCAAS